ncbi:AlwI family type II restriction endonuclease [Lactococcus cremoris]|uniref:AlwI family type II restriction endonuclease n=1 Tax=Lactococcus lactis subsp. cremoris TaxID=1359 RepID=UPI00223B7231|nr:AlwI family type II restriction endonuclease [Lactococcus cremoris]MCT0497475.1 AlwI family type II restriction endonuclease [Lactococcus cremoris]
MGKYSNTPFIWSFGTTSFRQRNLPLKLEIGCKALQNLRLKYPKDAWSSLYANFLDELNKFEVINYSGSLPEKDARAISSFLEQMGLCDNQRYLTEVGLKILALAEPHEKIENEFNISEYGYIYLLQLLKKTYIFQNHEVDEVHINPFVLILVCIIDNGYITPDEFKYFIMTANDNNEINQISERIKKYRESKDKEKYKFEYIVELYFSFKNSQKMYTDFVINNIVPDSAIRELGVNNNGSQYEQSQEKLYLLFKAHKNKNKTITLEEVEKIINSSSEGNKKYWKKLLLGVGRKQEDKQKYFETFLTKIENMKDLDFRKWFLYNWHFIKTQKLLDDYFDLNRRVLSMTELFSLETNLELNLFPLSFFKDRREELLSWAIESNNVDNYKYLKLEELYDGKLLPNSNKIYDDLSLQLNETVTASNVNYIIQEIKNQKFAEMVANKFDEDTVIQILEDVRDQYLATRANIIKSQEAKIQNAVSQDADVPTIFEYISAIAWYYISNKKIAPLESMNLALDGDLLPKTHASGGQADLLFKYRNYPQVPNHDFILEVTLNKDTNQRRAEMEPVSRHLGVYKIQNPNVEVYCSYLAHRLDKNTIIHFRQQKITPYYYQEQWAENNMIIPLEIDNVIYAIRNKIDYSNLYKIFKKAYESEAPLKEWWNSEIASQLS